jgi:AcrR family transcriptional regulator
VTTDTNLNSTKRAVLDSAERLFAQHGFEATSLRAITAAAAANLGAVNYHFSSKDALILAVLKRRMQPLNQERVNLLDRFEAEAGPRAVGIERILEALFRPALELIARPSKGGRYVLRLMAHCLASPGAYLRPLVEEEFAEKNRRFHEAIRRALPDLSKSEAHWRLHFAHGVFLHTAAQPQILELSSGGSCRFSDVESALRRMISFCAAGFRAPGLDLAGKKKR